MKNTYIVAQNRFDIALGNHVLRAQPRDLSASR